MNYSKIYQLLIETRRNRGIPQGYKEKHHILPRSFGGTNNAENLIYLTAREHFIAHRLLAKIYPDTGMVHAVYKMACTNRKMKRFEITGRVYEHLRIAHANRVSTDEVAKMKKSLAAKGKKQSEEHIKARTESRKQNGKSWLSDEAKLNMSKPRTKISSRKGRKQNSEREILGRKKGVETRMKNGSYTWTDEQKLAQSIRLTGTKRNTRPLTDDEKQKLREEKTKPVTCPHCGKVGAMMVMPRWHFDNCKNKI